MSKSMTDEMVDAAHELFDAAIKYRDLYEKQHGCQPVIWVDHEGIDETVFISDSFNSARIKSNL